MSEFKGTPGPWEAYRTVAPRGWNIEAHDGAYTVAVVRDGSSRPENTENARLIAAAPDLLKALVGLERLCTNHAASRGPMHSWWHDIHEARDAIYKALGDYA